MSGYARNAPFLPLNYRDARTVMIQNANGIKSNDIQEVQELLEAMRETVNEVPSHVERIKDNPELFEKFEESTEKAE